MRRTLTLTFTAFTLTACMSPAELARQWPTRAPAEAAYNSPAPVYPQTNACENYARDRADHMRAVMGTPSATTTCNTDGWGHTTCTTTQSNNEILARGAYDQALANCQGMSR